MAIDHRLKKLFGDFQGIDQKSTDLTRPATHATDILNSVYRSSGAISKRRGSHKTGGQYVSNYTERHYNLGTDTVPLGYGLVTYKDIDPTTGIVNERLLAFGQGAFEKKICQLRIQYTGTGNAWFSIYLDKVTKTFKFKIRQNNLTVLEYNLGTGGPGDPSIEDLRANIVNKTNFDALLVGFQDHSKIAKAAFLEPCKDIEISDYSLDPIDTPMKEYTGTFVKYYLWNRLKRPANENTLYSDESTITQYLTKLEDTDANKEIENLSFAQLHNVLYISSGYDYLLKYDGTTLYRAGLPQPASEPTSTAHNPSNANKYFYKIVYSHTDAKNNLVTGTSKKSSEICLPNDNFASGTVPINVPCLQTEGFNLPNIKIKVYRTKHDAGENGIYYYVGQINNNPSVSSVDFYDIKDDGEVSPFETYNEPTKKHSLPPKGKYITAIQDLLVISGQVENVNNIQYSIPFNSITGEIGCEYFPDDDNAKIVESRFGDKITAIAPLKDVLYIFHKNSIHTLSGNLTEDLYKVDLLTTQGGIGCEAVHSVEEFQGNLFFLSENGIYTINNSEGYPKEASSLISPLFKSISSSYNKRKAISFNWVKENLLLFIIPKESSGNSDILYTESDSKIFAFDTNNGSWVEWNGLDFSGGMALFDEKVFFLSRDVDSNTDVSATLHSFKESNSEYDYTDHELPIYFKYATNWESLDEPTLPKKFLRLKVYAMDSDKNYEENPFALNVSVQRNYVKDSIGPITLDFAGNSGGGWGIAPWGSALWGSGTLQELKTKLPSGKTRSLLLLFENNNLNENVLISGYELEVATPYRTEIKE